jgi:hypothetical protein
LSNEGSETLNERPQRRKPPADVPEADAMRRREDDEERPARRRAPERARGEARDDPMRRRVVLAPKEPEPPSARSRMPHYPPSVPRPPRNINWDNPKVDKYFGTKLPPTCRQLGCYLTDNGKYFFCVNPNCHKDKKRETKYNRRKKSVFYFFCPKCRSRDIQLHLKRNQYECLECAFAWRK